MNDIEVVHLGLVLLEYHGALGEKVYGTVLGHLQKGLFVKFVKGDGALQKIDYYLWGYGVNVFLVLICHGNLPLGVNKKIKAPHKNYGGLSFPVLFYE